MDLWDIVVTVLGAIAAFLSWWGFKVPCNMDYRP